MVVVNWDRGDSRESGVHEGVVLWCERHGA